MQYENTPISQNIEDRRGQGGGGGMMGGGGIGILGIIAVFAISYFTGINPAVLMGGAEIVSKSMNQGQSTQPATTGPAVDPNDPTRKFLAHVMGATEAVWGTVLPQQTGLDYTPATLVIYDGATRSGCGGAQAAMGPFYCPVDKKVYLDTSFFRDMKAKYGGGGDFAYAYVVAHEVGHHVQDELGILDKVDAAKPRVSQTQANALSVRVELQADCLAGSGRPTPTRSGRSSSRATSKRRSPPRRRSATTGCRRRRAATPCRTASPMARRRSGPSG